MDCLLVYFAFCFLHFLKEDGMDLAPVNKQFLECFELPALKLPAG